VRRDGAEAAVAGGRAALRLTLASFLAIALLWALAPPVLAQEAPDPGPPAGGGGVDLGPVLGGLGGVAAIGGLRDWPGGRWAELLAVVG
jgi:hypothetical protein